MASIRTKRIQKELQRIVSGSLPNVQYDDSSSEIKLDKLTFIITGAEGSLYNGEQFKVQFRFPQNYPLDSPEVIFVGKPPVHEHIYSNGHICLDILYDKWTPVLTIETVCISLISMLSSATVKKLPPDNESYVRNSVGRSPKQTKWGFHDDRV